MSKNIVICCDGTNGEFRLRNTNVVRLFTLLDHDSSRQIGFYDPGLGTMGSPGAWTRAGRALTKLLGLAFAYGLKDRIGGVYEHLMATYEPGDQVYFFGFSRGAYPVHESLKGGWRIMEWLPNHYWDMRGDQPVRRWRIPLGRRRFLRPPVTVHASVQQRLQGELAYRPRNLPDSFDVDTPSLDVAPPASDLAPASA